MSNVQPSQVPVQKPANRRVENFKDFFSKLKKNKAALVGLYVLIFFFFVSIFGALDSNYHFLGVNSNATDRKSTRLNSSHVSISYAVFCLKKKKLIIKNKQFT